MTTTNHLSTGQRAFIYGLCGIGLEVTYTALRKIPKLQGFTQLWVFPLYAIAGLSIEKIQAQLAGKPLYVRAGVYAALVFAIEYAGGWTAEKITGKCPWKYGADYPWSVHGYINLTHAPLWGAAGLLAEKIDQALLSLRWHNPLNQNGAHPVLQDKAAKHGLGKPISL